MHIISAWFGILKKIISKDLYLFIIYFVWLLDQKEKPSHGPKNLSDIPCIFAFFLF